MIFFNIRVVVVIGCNFFDGRSHDMIMIAFNYRLSVRSWCFVCSLRAMSSVGMTRDRLHVHVWDRWCCGLTGSMSEVDLI